MTQDGVSPVQGHEPIAGRASQRHPILSSIAPYLTSQYRGLLAFNMAETPEEKAAREAKEAKEKEDNDKKDNFKKVKEKAESLEAERDQLLKEKKEREEADRKAAEKKLADEKQFEELAKTKDAEATKAKEEAAAEKKRADDLQAKVKEHDDEQEAELVEILKTIPEDKKPPLDPADPVAKRLKQAKHVQSLLSEGKPPIGGGARNDKKGTERLEELKKKDKNRLTADEAMELMEHT